MSFRDENDAYCEHGTSRIKRCEHCEYAAPSPAAPVASENPYIAKRDAAPKGSFDWEHYDRCAAAYAAGEAAGRLLGLEKARDIARKHVALYECGADNVAFEAADAIAHDITVQLRELKSGGRR